MSSSLVLMKALPFTKGHEALIRFALSVTPGRVEVLTDFAPREPLVGERVDWIRNTFPREPVNVRQIMVQPQREEDDPDNFWPIWEHILSEYKFKNIKYVIGSEPYCQKVADIIGAKYLTFDPERTLFDTRATEVRQDPMTYYRYMAHATQKHFRTKVVVWGAESTGKTTLAKNLSKVAQCPWVHEYARPYLEATSPDINADSMQAIWKGQWATEELMINAQNDSPFLVQDTDLYSTIGYWEQPHWKDDLGPVPWFLYDDAARHKADLYLITTSNIPFEPDPLRYGVDHRESSDTYWINKAEEYDLNYVVIDGMMPHDRTSQALSEMMRVQSEKTEPATI